MKSQKRPVIRNTRSQKENNAEPVTVKCKIKSQNKPLRSLRKVLADKTNSGSDENSTKGSVNKIMSKEETSESNREYDIPPSQRPRRTHRLPSKFDDHAMTPLNFMFSARPNISSTPINETESISTPVIKKNHLLELSKSDTNNNAQSEIKKHSKREIFRIICGDTQCYKTQELTAKQRPVELEGINKKSESPNGASREHEENNEKCTLADGNKLDIYEFDFDPSEEPQIKKVKKKRRKYSKKKKFDQFFCPKGSTYNINIAKTVESLKDLIVSKKTNTERVKEYVGDINRKEVITFDTNSNTEMEFDYEDNTRRAENDQALNLNSEGNNGNVVMNAVGKHIPEPNKIINKKISNGDLSFFDDDLPVANSTLNTTSLNNKPVGSPWRVELDIEPRRWPVNFHVKPNMTPAYDSTFQHVGLDRTSSTPPYPRQKGKYMNEICDPTLFENNIEKLKQTTILSFFEDVLSKSAQKSKKASRVDITPEKNVSSSLFQESNNDEDNLALLSVTKSIFSTPPKQTSRLVSETNRIALCELSVNSPVRNQMAPINVENKVSSPSPTMSIADSPGKTNKENTKKKDNKKKEIYYGFDSDDQENVSPNANVNRRRMYGLRAREQHKQRRLQKLPMRMESIPLKITNTQLLQVACDNEPNLSREPQTKELRVICTEEKEPTEAPTESEDFEPLAGPDSPEQVVCLFEDYLPKVNNNVNLKRYGRARQPPVQRKRKVSVNGFDIENCDAVTNESEEPALFTVKAKRPVKRRKKEVRAKEEDKEVDAWAASFNSMLEEVNEFPLVVE